MKTFDELQQNFTEIGKSFMRGELSKDFYHGKIQAVMITTNIVTGKVNIDTCNVNLIGDTKKILREGLEQLERAQMANAIYSTVNAALMRAKKDKRGKKR